MHLGRVVQHLVILRRGRLKVCGLEQIGTGNLLFLPSKQLEI
jgi:hypothetical protein